MVTGCTDMHLPPPPPPPPPSHPRTLSRPGSPTKNVPLSSLFYTEVTLILITLVVGSCALLLHKVPLFLWLPSVLLLAAACVSLASLIYLNRGVALHNSNSLLLYIILTLGLVIFRFFCSALLVFSIFLPHSAPIIGGPLLITSLTHSFFGFVAIGRTSMYRTRLDKRRAPHKENGIVPVEEIAVGNLSMHRLVNSSTTTLFTNVDENEETLLVMD